MTRPDAVVIGALPEAALLVRRMPVEAAHEAVTAIGGLAAPMALHLPAHVDLADAC